MKKFRSVFTRGLLLAAFLTAGITETGRAEEATPGSGKLTDSNVIRITPDGPSSVRVDETRKPVLERVGLPKEMTKARDLTRSVYRPDSALPYQDPLTSATGPSSATTKRVPALAGGVIIEGSVYYSLGATTGYFTADRVSNNRSGGTSGTLRLELWATTNAPGSGSVNGYRLATYTLGTLQAGYYFSNLDSGTFSYTQPPSGCYYISLLLTEFDGTGYPYIDYALFSNRLTFRGGSCVGCTEDAYTMCLIGGRYRVTSHWLNQYATPPSAATLSKTKLTDNVGAFWIADANTYEYLIRFQTGTNNGRAWIAIPTFTSVEFWMAVTDTVNGQSKEYHNTPGNVTMIYDPYFFIYP